MIERLSQKLLQGELTWYRRRKAYLDACRKAAANHCAICDNEFDRTKAEPHLDHCHETNVFRGFLCRNCNWMLGHAKDNVRILASAIQYLETARL